MTLEQQIFFLIGLGCGCIISAVIAILAGMLFAEEKQNGKET